ncbi:MAG: LamG-like jellyroll fold domain-containing protein [Candidatus Thermoplasmatota archaeon]
MGNDGSLTNFDYNANSGWTTDCKYGRCLKFDGVNDYVEVSDDASLNFGTGDFSVFLWAYPHTIAERHAINKANPATDLGFFMGMDGGRLQVRVKDTDGTVLSRSVGTFNANEWSYIGFTVEKGSSMGLKIYINDQVIDTSSTVGLDNTNAPYNLQIGQYASTYWNGKIDNVKIYSRALTTDEIKSDYLATKDNYPNWAKTEITNGAKHTAPLSHNYDGGAVGIWKFDEGAGNITTDASGNGNSGTINGATWVDGKFGKALSFDGDDYVMVSNPKGMKFSTSNQMTLEGWFYLTAHSDYDGIVCVRQNGEYARLLVDPGLGPYYDIFGADQDVPGYTFSQNSWYHYAMTVQGGGTASIYINGELIHQSANGVPVTLPDVVSVYIGTGEGAGTHPLQGYVDEVRIYPRALTATEIYEHYSHEVTKYYDDFNVGIKRYVGVEDSNTNLQPITPKDTVLHLRFNEGTGTKTKDISGYGNDGTINGATWDSSQNNFGKALKFDGVDDYVQISTPAGSGLTNLENGTVSLWFKPSVDYNPTTDWDMLVGAWPDPTDGNWNLELGYHTRCKIDFQIRGGNIIQSDSDTFNSGVWYHVAVSWEKNGKLKMYIDGVLQSDVKDNIAPYGGNADKNIQIAQNFGWGNNFNGLIDEVLIINRSLSSTEIFDMYLGGAIRRFGDTNLVMALRFEEGEGEVAYDWSREVNHGLLRNGVLWTDGKYGKALEFDGNDDYVSVKDRPSLNPTKITVEAWIEPYKFPTDYGTIINKTNYAIEINKEGKVNFTIWNGSEYCSLISDIALEISKWNHVVGTYDGINARVYINGKIVGQKWVDKLSLLTGSLNIGSFAGTNSFNGRIDEVRIYNKPLSIEEISLHYLGGYERYHRIASFDELKYLEYILKDKDWEKQIDYDFVKIKILVSISNPPTIYMGTGEKKAVPTQLSISINNDALYTTDTKVTLQLSGLNLNYIRLSDDGAVWYDWESFSSVRTYILPGTDGLKKVYYQGMSLHGIKSIVVYDEIILDTSPPTGSILINGGAKYTNSTTVNLELKANDEIGLGEMSFSLDGSSWSVWEKYSSSKQYMLMPGEGKKELWVKFKDLAGHISPSYKATIILDKTPPNGFISMPDYTNKTKVNISLGATDSNGVESMRLSNSEDMIDNWEPYNLYKVWEILGNEGENKVCVEYKDRANLTSKYCAKTFYDSSPPNLNITYPLFTSSRIIELYISYSDASGISSIRTSFDGLWDKEYWELPKNTITLVLPEGEGEKRVYFQAMDKAGNIAEEILNISLDLTPPNGTMKINDGALYTNNRSVSVSFKAIDNYFVSYVRLSNDGIYWSSWFNYSENENLSWELSYGDGVKNLYAQFIDVVGLVSKPIIEKIIFDTKPPSSKILGVPRYIGKEKFNITLCAEDETSGIDSYSVYFSNGLDYKLLVKDTNEKSIEFEGENGYTYSFYVIAKDRSGIEENKSFYDAIVTIDIDKPETELMFRGKYYDAKNKIYVKPSSLIYFIGEDEISGIREISYLLDGKEEIYKTPIPLEVGEHYLEYRGIDNAGNEEAWHKIFLIIDGDEPKTIPIFHGYDIYMNKTGNISFEVYDVCPHVTYYKIDFGNWKIYNGKIPATEIGSGLHMLSYYSVDILGNEEMGKSTTIFFDSIEPQTTLKNWKEKSNENLYLELKADDIGSGIFDTYFKIDDGILQNGTHVLIEAPSDHSNDGLHKISYYSIDKVGNREIEKEKFVYIDTVIDLNIDIPSIVSTREIKIKGTTEPNSTVFVSDNKVKVDDEGKFSRDILLSFGENRIEIKVFDDAGNKKVLVKTVTSYPTDIIIILICLALAIALSSSIYLMRDRIRERIAERRKAKEKERIVIERRARARMRKCPYCNETIDIRFEICPYCEKSIRKEPKALEKEIELNKELVEKVLKHCKNIIDEGKADGLDLRDAERYLKIAKVDFERGAYKKVMETTLKITATVEKVGKRATLYPLVSDKRYKCGSCDKIIEGGKLIFRCSCDIKYHEICAGKIKTCIKCR